MHFKPSKEQTGIQWHSQQSWKQTLTTNKVIPECHSGQAHFISADGYYMPCCYVGDHRFYYKTKFGKNKNQYSIENTTLSEILDRTAVAEFYDKLANEPVCQFSCGEQTQWPIGPL